MQPRPRETLVRELVENLRELERRLQNAARIDINVGQCQGLWGLNSTGNYN